MTDIVAIGSSAFIPGFALAGIATELANESTIIAQVRAHKGIVILDGDVLTNLDAPEREELKTSIEPVVVTLSATGADEIAQLRRTIKNTMGVDLLK